MYILVMYDLYPPRLLNNFINACGLIVVEDVASISWIFILFVSFIALIEIGRYTWKLRRKLFVWEKGLLRECVECVVNVADRSGGPLNLEASFLSMVHR